MKSNNRNTNLFLISRIWHHLSKKRKFQFFLIVLLMLLSGISELFSLASLFPLLTVITNPKKLWDISFIEDISISNGITDPSQLILPATIFFALCIVIASFIKLFSLWINGRYSAAVGTEFSYKIFKKNIFQPYEIQISRNTSKIIAANTNQIDITIITINLILQMITGGIVSFILIGALFFTSKSALIYLSTILGVCYFAFVFLLKKNLLKDSLNVSKRTVKAIKILQESFGGIREIIIESNQEVFLRIFRGNDLPLRRFRERVRFIQLIPKIIIEAIGIISIAFFAYAISGSEDYLNFIPILGSIILGAQKLLPNIQQIYASWTGIKSSTGNTLDVLDMLDQKVILFRKPTKKFIFNQKINFVNVSFKYEKKSNYTIKDLSLEIQKGERIGIIGNTGSGKSTFLCILMGLLLPESGEIIIDNNNIHSKKFEHSIQDWFYNIAHVPQNIFLKDSTILENIAFGEKRNNIDIEKVKDSARKAQISNFIEKLPLSYDSFVGERGIKLSGGQKQRIGIARALYKKKNLMVLDEATSSLDYETEEKVMKSLDDLGFENTLIIVAHRLSTLKNCDRILEFKNGKIINQLKPKDLLERE